MIRRIKFCLKAKFKRKSVRPNQNNVAIVHNSEIQKYEQQGNLLRGNVIWSDVASSVD